MREISLGLLLFAFWLALSGHYTPFLITIGALCAAFCVFVGSRMRILDGEAHPIHLLSRATTYYPWLAWEIAKSAWGVSKIIVDPRLPISPTMTTVESSQRTAAGLATYANSITLTPGTITTNVRANHLTVHALVREGALDLEGGVMDARVRQFEGGGA